MKLVELYIYTHSLQMGPNHPICSPQPPHPQSLTIRWVLCVSSRLFYKNETYTHISTNGAPCHILQSCFKGAVCLLLFPHQHKHKQICLILITIAYFSSSMHYGLFNHFNLIEHLFNRSNLHIHIWLCRFEKYIHRTIFWCQQQHTNQMGYIVLIYKQCPNTL